MERLASFVLLSAQLAMYPAEINNERANNLEATLKWRGMDHAPTLGSYKGTPERSCMVMAEEGSYEFDACISLARRYGQESILFVDGGRNAVLIMIETGAEAKLPGRFRPVTAEAAATLDAWTQRNGQHYAVVRG